MDRMVIVLFDSEAQASEAENALLRGEAEGSVNIDGCATLVRHDPRARKHAPVRNTSIDDLSPR